MPQDDRRDFKPYQVELVYKEQDGCCKKCGKPLGHGFIRDHENGNHCDNSIGNLRLLCASCNGSEAYATYRKQMIASFNDTNVLVKKAIDGAIAGTIVDKALDAIKLSLSLNTQLYGYEIEKPPAAIAAQQYIESSKIMLDQWEEALKQGILKGIDMAKEAVRNRPV
jgi:hypothetical protein